MTRDPHTKKTGMNVQTVVCSFLHVCVCGPHLFMICCSYSQSLLVAMADRRGGFDCEFVESPPKIVQSECPVCLLVLCEPYQVTCCGYSYCKVCIERVKADKEPCPCCKNDFDDFPNKGLQQSLSGFKVFCSHRKEGCQWIGEFGQLESHLNVNSSHHHQLEGCAHAEVRCQYCFKLYKRSQVLAHQSDFCPLRPFTCQHCKMFHSHYEDVVSNHMPRCGCCPVGCPNECGATVLLRDVERHISDDCPLTVITVQVRRKDLPPHHALVGAQVSDQVSDVRRELAEFKKEVATLSRVSAFGPIEMTLVNFARAKRRNEVWRSSPFYSDIRGYKFCLVIAANGLGLAKNTHVSVVVYLMRGSFDSQLRWPFRGRITIQLLDQTGSNHITHLLDFSHEVCNQACKRVPFWRGVSSIGLRKGFFVAHSDLTPNYLVDDCLYFQVSKVELP